MADEPKAQPIKYWKIQADGLADLGMFYQCSLPSMTLTANDFKVWDDKSKPNPLPVGVQASFGDVTLSRGVDKQSTDTVKEVTLMACDAEGEPVQTWVLKNAYPSSYQAAGMAASGVDVLTEQVSIHYTEAQLDGKGGLTGTIGG